MSDITIPARVFDTLKTAIEFATSDGGEGIEELHSDEHVAEMRRLVGLPYQTRYEAWLAKRVNVKNVWYYPGPVSNKQFFILVDRRGIFIPNLGDGGSVTLADAERDLWDSVVDSVYFEADVDPRAHIND